MHKALGLEKNSLGLHHSIEQYAHDQNITKMEVLTGLRIAMCLDQLDEETLIGC